MVIGWLDNNTVVYHERYSANKQDGITVGDLGTGARRVFPFFDVQALAPAGDGFVVFSTWVPSEKSSTYVLFLLDTKTGDAWPLFEGVQAAWQGSGQIVSMSIFGGV